LSFTFNNVGMLFPKDFGEIEELVRDIVKEEIKHLLNKEEFYGKMDELMVEIKAVREEQEVHSSQHSEINDQLEKLGKQTDIPSAT